METTIIGMETLMGAHFHTKMVMLIILRLPVNPDGTEMIIMVRPAVEHNTGEQTHVIPDTTDRST